MPDPDPASSFVTLRKTTGFRVKPGMTKNGCILFANCDTSLMRGDDEKHYFSDFLRLHQKTKPKNIHSIIVFQTSLKGAT